MTHTTNKTNKNNKNRCGSPLPPPSPWGATGRTAAAASRRRRGARGPLLLQICSGPAMGLRSVDSQPPLPPPRVPTVGRRCTGSWPPPRSARGVRGPPPLPWEPWVIFFSFSYFSEIEMHVGLYGLYLSFERFFE